MHDYKNVFFLGCFHSKTKTCSFRCCSLISLRLVYYDKHFQKKFQTLSCAIKNFSRGMCVHDIFFLKLHVSAHQVVSCWKFFFGNDHVHEFFLYKCACRIFFFKITHPPTPSASTFKTKMQIRWRSLVPL